MDTSEQRFFQAVLLCHQTTISCSFLIWQIVLHHDFTNDTCLNAEAKMKSVLHPREDNNRNVGAAECG